ncbi:SRPBCC family protein [Streptomyces halobius]|uniref:SRPBCC domain-containing protein n=1 Tax=Streptomyces halobius TaxID=2879846 RepID=A0ABY4M568_9ACTN|nr:SRPBCC domain-containing protein [Streptomyces halobius]UQA92522.1 SRPBCC domain-containing protein [Streptomyces halobius]
MTVIDVQKNPETLTLTITARFDAPPARVWQIWQDPRQLERWWGPPTYPATVVDHDLTPGGAVTYFMTGPEGDKHNGWWRIVSVDAPYRLEFEDGFADDSGHPNPDMPTMTVRVQLTAEGETATTMTIESTFPTPEAMEQLVSMGMVEGMSAALNQVDALLAGPAA